MLILNQLFKATGKWWMVPHWRESSSYPSWDTVRSMDRKSGARCISVMYGCSQMLCCSWSNMKTNQQKPTRI